MHLPPLIVSEGQTERSIQITLYSHGIKVYLSVIFHSKITAKFHTESQQNPPNDEISHTAFGHS